jgi:hypothetical protein
MNTLEVFHKFLLRVNLLLLLDNTDILAYGPRGIHDLILQFQDSLISEA